MSVIKNRYKKTNIRKEVFHLTNVTPEEAKREYYRKWRKTHKENVIASNARYWQKKAAEMNSTTEEANTDRKQTR